jgi:pyruvate dehydrogenase E2 component (dihydrolipoamide acetyltransferase)
MAEFRMPSLGADMDAGTIVEWLVHPGDVVHRGDIVAVVDTEKSDIEVEVFDDGVVEELLVAEGEEVPVGTPLARITSTEPSTTPTPPSASPNEPSPTPREPAPSPKRRTAGSVHSPLVRHLAEKLDVDTARVEGSGPRGSITRADVEHAASIDDHTRPPAEVRRVTASPRARRSAQEAGIDLSGVRGTGPGGAVVAADLQQAPAVSADVQDVAAASADRKTLLRQSIGDLMSRSKREIPHYYLSTTIDLDAALTWLTEHNADRPVTSRVLPAALLLRAVARACEAVGSMNGHFVDGAFVPSDQVHLGVAISLRGGGLIAPALSSAEASSVDELMTRLSGLVERARAGRLRASEMIDPTITVTNLGDQGADSVFGVIYPPQVAIVGFGQVVERPWAIGGMLTVRPIVTATLAADHRVSDGRDGARFLAALNHLLQHPEDL